jgi:hypothetical protein
MSDTMQVKYSRKEAQGSRVLHPAAGPGLPCGIICQGDGFGLNDPHPSRAKALPAAPATDR